MDGNHQRDPAGAPSPQAEQIRIESEFFGSFMLRSQKFLRPSRRGLEEAALRMKEFLASRSIAGMSGGEVFAFNTGPSALLPARARMHAK